MLKTGHAHVYGDNIDTDRIIAGKYTKTLNPQDLADHVLEDLDPEFRTRLVTGDFLAAGTNFGCGSSREQAPLALLQAGVSVVIAETFSRIFYRNAINIGLPLLEIRNHGIRSGDRLEVDISRGEVRNLSTGAVLQGHPMPKVMVDILAEGGLVPYLSKYKEYRTE